MLAKNGLGRPASCFVIAFLMACFLFLAASGGSALPDPSPSPQGSGDSQIAFPEAGHLPYRPGEVLVKFKSAAAEECLDTLMAMAGVDGVLEEIGRQGRELIQLLKLTSGVSVERAVQALQSLAGVVYAEPNYIARAAYTPSDPDYQPEQWGLHNTGQTIDGQAGTSDADIDGPEAWDIERGQSNPVTVAVIDTGIDLGHPDLSGKIGGGCNWAGITQSRYYYYDYSYTPPQRYTTARYFGYSSSTLKRAQSITGTGQPLDHVGFFLQKTGSPTGNITVSLRSARDGMSLASYTITPAEVSVIRSEIYKQLSPAVTLTSGSTYYLVLETANNDSTNYYYLYDNWGTSNPSTDQYDPYRDGQESRWDGSVWVEYPNDDLYFRTNPNAAPRDDNGHGTHVGGIIGAEANNGNGGVGVSFGAHLMPLKALDCTGSGPYSDIISAIYYAADNGAGVINMSLGGPSSSSALQDAVNYAHGNPCYGVSIAVASRGRLTQVESELRDHQGALIASAQAKFMVIGLGTEVT